MNTAYGRVWSMCRRAMLLVGLAMLGGCDTTVGGVLNSQIAGTDAAVQGLQGFAADLARQVLAALLL